MLKIVEDWKMGNGGKDVEKKERWSIGTLKRRDVEDRWSPQNGAPKSTSGSLKQWVSRLDIWLKGWGIGDKKFEVPKVR